MTTAQQLIEAGYARSTANDPGKLAGDSELLGFLDRQYQRYYAMLAHASPDRAQSKMTLLLVGIPGAAALSTDIIDIRRVQNATGGKVRLIDVVELDRSWHLAPCVYRQGGNIISRGAAGDPVLGDVLTLWVLDAPAAIAALASVLDSRWLSRFDELLVLEIAAYLAGKDADRNEADWNRLNTDLARETQIFAQLTGFTNTVKDTPVDTAVRIVSSGARAERKQ